MTLTELKHKWQQTLIQLTPGQLVIQVTDKCNATCPQCSMRITEPFKRQSLDSGEIFKMIDAAGPNGVKAISFTGGEPFLMLDDLCAYINRAGNNKIPFIRTGTNGFFFTGSQKPGFTDKVEKTVEKLAQTPVRNVWISIDSCDAALHESMRGFKGVFEGIKKALPIFESANIYPSVNLGINRNLGGDMTRQLSRRDFATDQAYEDQVYSTYCQAFSKFYETVIDMGFTIANACYPMSVDDSCTDLDPVYQASAVDHVIKFTPDEKHMIFKALRDTIPKYRGQIRIFSPQTSLHALVKDLSRETPVSYPCQGGINYFFVDAASGDTYPCGYRGQDNFGKFYQMNGTLPGTLDTDCRRCDWECFRDPSELAGPLLDLLGNPVQIIRKIVDDPGHLALWAKDLLYYNACDYFNGRKPPRYSSMKRFSTGS